MEGDQDDLEASEKPSLDLPTASSSSDLSWGGMWSLLLGEFLQEAGAGGPRSVVLRKEGLLLVRSCVLNNNVQACIVNMIVYESKPQQL